MSVTLSVYKILECLLETDTFDSIFQLGIANEELYASLQEIKEAVQNENILQAPPVLTMVGPQTHSLEETIYGDSKQITLEITERCDFRCNYCIYSEGYESFREFGNKDMSFDAAQKAIDDLKNRSKNQKIVKIKGLNVQRTFCVLFYVLLRAELYSIPLCFKESGEDKLANELVLIF